MLKVTVGSTERSPSWQAVGQMQIDLQEIQQLFRALAGQVAGSSDLCGPYLKVCVNWKGNC